MFMGDDVMMWYMYTLHNEQIRLISISIASYIYQFFVMKPFKIKIYFFSGSNFCNPDDMTCWMSYKLMLRSQHTGFDTSYP
jgi:hypothetical protein